MVCPTKANCSPRRFPIHARECERERCVRPAACLPRRAAAHKQHPPTQTRTRARTHAHPTLWRAPPTDRAAKRLVPPRPRQTDRVNSIDFHRSEDIMVTGGDDESIHVYNSATGELTKTIFSKKYGVDCVRFTHAPHAILCASKNGSWDETLRYLSLHDNRYLRYFRGHRGRVTSLAMSPLDDSFISASMDKTVRVWDLRTNACQGMLRAPATPCAAFDEQGMVMGMAMEGQLGANMELCFKLYDVRVYGKGPFDTFRLAGAQSAPTHVAFSPDGALVLMATKDGSLCLLDAFQGQQKHLFHCQPPEDEKVHLQACFSPDGKYVLCGSQDGAIHVWSTESGEEVAQWKGHADTPGVVRWAPRRMMVTSACSALAFWLPDLDKLGTQHTGGMM